MGFELTEDDVALNPETHFLESLKEGGEEEERRGGERRVRIETRTGREEGELTR